MSKFQRFSTAAMPVMMLFAGLVHADAGGYEMSAYMDGAGSEEVLAGRYQAAIEAARTASVWPSQEDRLIASTNLCVANTVQSDFPAAEKACARALMLARAVDIPGRSLTRRRAATAMALSNLGVLNALSGDTAAAERSLRKAARLGAWEAASRNLAHLEASDRSLPRVARTGN